MTSSQSSFNDFTTYITPSEMIEFLYCNRFIYYMKCLGISQNEETRFKVQMGRNLHERKEKINKDYVRKKIGSVKKLIEVPLISEKYKIKGKVDEINFLEDGTAAPLDYKFAEYKEITFKTYKTQMIFYSIMIEEMFNVKVNKAFLVYCRGGNELVEIDITQDLIDGSLENINSYNRIIAGYYPPATKDRAKCLDCCYRNICVR